MKKIFFFSIVFIIVSQVFAQQQVLVKSDLIPGTDTVWVFTPKSYSKNKVDYPAVVMLHGWSGNYKQWNKLMGAQKYADTYQMIIICPDGFYDCWYLNSPLKKNSQFVTFFFDKLMPDLFSKYRIDTSKLFITGLSMGGHGALNLYFSKPEFFLSAGSTSGVVDMHDPLLKKFGVPALIGEYGNENWTTFSAYSHVANLKGKNKKMIVDCGTEDFLYKSNNAFAAQCKELGIDIVYITQPGKHEGKYWRQSIKAHFDFFKSLINEQKK